MNIAILLSQFQIELSLQEAITIAKPEKFKLIKQLLLMKVKDENEFYNKIKQASFSKKVFQLNPKIVKGSYKLIKKEIISKVNFQPTLRKFSHLTIDVKHPDHQIYIFGIGKELVGKLVYENKDKFENRKAHNRPNNHPTSIDPRIARAMVNLADSNKLIDPFCGSGGLLIEGALTKKEMKGYDNDLNQIQRAKANLKHYNLKCELKCQDSTKKVFTENIVTDLPYGKNSKLIQANSNLIEWLFKNKSPKMIICYNKKIGIRKGWKLYKIFSIKVHKSLTRYIHIYHNSSILA